MKKNEPFQIDFSEVKHWVGNQKHRDNAKKNALKAIGIQAENLIKTESIKIMASGKLQRSINHRVEKDELTVYGTKYAEEALETGRKPGKAPPLEAIKGWARKRGIPEGMAYRIQQQIGEIGTRKYRYKGPKQITRSMKFLQKYVDDELIELLEEFVK